MNFDYEIALLDKTSDLVGIKHPGYITIAGVEVVGVSQAEMQRGNIEKYIGAYERFTRAIILGLRGMISVDFFTDGKDLAVRLLVGCVHDKTVPLPWSPHAQLERLRRQVTKGVQLSLISPVNHIEALTALKYADSIEPAVEEVSFRALTAATVLPLDLSPSGIGTLAQVLDGLQVPCCVRLIIAPLVRPRPSTTKLIDYMANADQLCSGTEIPPAIAYRAQAIRFALQRMMNSFLGQACVTQIQVRSAEPKQVDGIIQLLRNEIARPKMSEINNIKGNGLEYTLKDNQNEIPIIAALPSRKPIPTELISPAPIPSFWIDGSGEKDKHIASIESVAILPIPPLPEYCDLRAISSIVVESKGAIRPEKWSVGGIPIGKDSLGNDISLDDESLSRHVHLIGVPGSGKTTLMFQMVNADLAAGRGFVIFDPHGDLGQRVAFVAGWVPGKIASNLAFPGLRLLSSSSDGDAAVERDIGAILEAIESALLKEWTGPIFRQMARACLTLHAYVGAGSLISDAVKYVQDEDAWMNVSMEYSGPQWVTDFFENHHRQEEKDKADRSDWFACKFSDYLRTSAAITLFAPVGQGLTAIELVNSKAQLVIDFAALGTSTFDAGLLGQLFITSFLRNLTAAGPNPNRRFLMYLDEVQLFYGPAVERALQEGRKYGLSVVAAHQTSSQLSQERFDSLVGQVGLELVFRCSMKDSQLLADHLNLNVDSIASLSDLSCWVGGGIALQRGGSFSLTTTWMPRNGSEIGNTYLSTAYAYLVAGRYPEARAMAVALLKRDQQDKDAQALTHAIDEADAQDKTEQEKAEPTQNLNEKGSYLDDRNSSVSEWSELDNPFDWAGMLKNLDSVEISQDDSDGDGDSDDGTLGVPVSPQDLFQMLGLQDLPDDEKKILAEKLEQIIQEQTIHLVVSQLSDEQCEKLNNQMDAGMTQTEVIDYLRNEIPDLEDQIRRHVETFREDILREVEDIRSELEAGQEPGTEPKYIKEFPFDDAKQSVTRHDDMTRGRVDWQLMTLWVLIVAIIAATLMMGVLAWAVLNKL